MAVDAFIKFEKGVATMADVTGECPDPMFKGFFAIKDFSFGAENRATIGSATSGAGGGKIQFNEFTIRKAPDATSPFLFKNCAAGLHYRRVTLAIRQAGGMANQAVKPFLIFNFGIVVTTKIAWSGPDEDGSVESLTFAYGAFDVAYARQKPDGSTDAPQNASWNQVTNRSEFAEGTAPTISF